MVFLNPAVLFGFFAASIPIIIHLLNLRKLKRIEFSTLAFLKELQKNKIKKVKIKQWILLALRTLIIISLVLSFARPTIKSTAITGTGSAAKTTVVIIIDNTYSMSLINDKGSYLNQAIKTAKSLLNQLQEGDDVYIIPLSTPNKLIHSSNFSKVKTELDNIQISYVSTPLHSAITKAANLISKSDNFNKEIYILSDFQKKRLSDEETISSNLSSLLNQQVRLYSFNFSGKESANLTLSELSSTNQIFRIGKEIGFEALVSNYGNIAVSNSVVSLFINGERTAQQNVTLNPGESKKVEFSTLLKKGGNVEVFAELEDDEIKFDNKRFLSIEVPEKINLLLLYDNQNDLYFIKTALIQNDSLSSITVYEKPLSNISSLNLNDYNTIIIVGSETFSNYSPIKDYLANSGNLIIFPSSKSTGQNFKKLLESINIPFSGETVGGINNKAGYNFGYTDFSHPLFNDLFSNTNKQKIQSPSVYFYFKLKSGSNGRSLIEMEDKSPFLAEYNFKLSKVLVFNSAPIPDVADFPLKGIFAPIINKSVYYLSVKNYGDNSINAGSDIYINIANLPVTVLQINKPENQSEVLSTDSLINKSVFDYKNTETIGIYKIINNSKIINSPSVNINPIESDLNYLTDTEFKKYLTQLKFEGNYYKLDPNQNYLQSIYQSRFGAELWRLFLIIAFILAVIEMLVSKSSKKDLTKLG